LIPFILINDTIFISQFQKKNMIKQAKKLQLTGPPYVYFGPDALSGSSLVLTPSQKVDRVLKEVTTGMLIITPSDGFERGKAYTNLQKILANFEPKNSDPKNPLFPFTTYAADAAYTVVFGLDNYFRKYGPSKKVDTTKLLEEFLKLEFNGASGRVSFDSMSERENAVYSIQNFDGSKNIVRPLGFWSISSGFELHSKPVWPNGKTSPIPG
jgi:hypothetical protein